MLVSISRLVGVYQGYYLETKRNSGLTPRKVDQQVFVSFLRSSMDVSCKAHKKTPAEHGILDNSGFQPF